jgi:hypothetical protein
MEYVENEYSVIFNYDNVRIACYSKGGHFVIGDKLNISSYPDRGLFFSTTSDSISINSNEYRWVVDLHESIADGNYIIEDELLTKCLDLYNLLEYRWEKALSNVYDGDIVGYPCPFRDTDIEFISNNKIKIYERVYNVSDNFMAKALADRSWGIYISILREEHEIWKNAFPSKVKSARN